MGLKKKSNVAILLDWIVIILLCIAYFLIYEYMEVHSQCIPGGPPERQCNEYMTKPTPFLGFPFRKSKVYVWYPYLFGTITWLLVIVINLTVECVTEPVIRKYDMLLFACRVEALFRELCTSLIITQLVVLCIKRFVGRPRPFFYEYYSVNSTNALESFPSGHASSSFCMHVLLVLHCLYAMHWSSAHCNRNVKLTLSNAHCLFGAAIWRRFRLLNGLKVLCIVLLLLLPTWISASRITDYYHNYSDVLCGALLGTGVSSIVFAVFRQEIYRYSRSDSI